MNITAGSLLICLNITAVGGPIIFLLYRCARSLEIRGEQHDEMWYDYLIRNGRPIPKHLRDQYGSSDDLVIPHGVRH